MNTLNVLEQKVSNLITLIRELKERNEELKAEVEDLKAENNRQNEEKRQLVAQLESLEGSSGKEQEQIETLYQEKEKTRAAVDDLLNRLKAIDALAECESQS